MGIGVFAAACGLYLLGCGTGPDSPVDLQGEQPLLSNKGSSTMNGFSWVIDKQVAGMPYPGTGQTLEKNLGFLREQGVDVLVSLTETPVSAEALAKQGIEPMHIPVPDFHAPTQDQLDQYVGAVQGWMSEGLSVGTHCHAGLGRTGTFLAALFVARGMDAEAAMAEIRKLRPGSIETKAQEDAVREFAARQKK